SLIAVAFRGKVDDGPCRSPAHPSHISASKNTAAATRKAGFGTAGLDFIHDLIWECCKWDESRSSAVASRMRLSSCLASLLIHLSRSEEHTSELQSPCN